MARNRGQTEEVSTLDAQPSDHGMVNADARKTSIHFQDSLQKSAGAKLAPIAAFGRCAATSSVNSRICNAAQS